MKSPLIFTLLVAGSLGAAFAQGPVYRDQYGTPRYGNRGYRNDNRDYDRGGYSAPRGGAVERVLGNLSRAESSGRMDRHAWKQIDQARRDLERFQEKSLRGRFDHGKLDNAIGHLQSAVNSRRMDPRARDMVSRNLYELREFRARGAYGRSY